MRYPGGCFCKVMILQGLPSTITKKLFILKELWSFWGCFLVKSGFIEKLVWFLNRWKLVRFDIIRRLLSCGNGYVSSGLAGRNVGHPENATTTAKAAGRKVRRYKGNGKSANAEIGAPGKEKCPKVLGSGGR